MITVVYYTSNREDKLFEANIRSNLLDVIGDLPLISVSHRPLNFGRNICVGENVGVSDANIYRQLLIGCEEASTELIATAESDCLYPPTGYFDFVPDDVNMAYRYTNLWVLYTKACNKRRWKKGFLKKGYSSCAQISGRDYLIRYLRRQLDTLKNNTWTADKFKIKDFFWDKSEWVPFWNHLPIITLKTCDGLRKLTGRDRNTDPVRELPHWGTTKEVFRRLYKSQTV